MNYANLFKIAIKAIRNNKIRSLLTMLGIIIGITAVILIRYAATGESIPPESICMVFPPTPRGYPPVPSNVLVKI